MMSCVRGLAVGCCWTVWRRRGCRVGVPWRLNTPEVFMTPAREFQLGAVLDWLGGTHAYASGHPWLVTQVLADEARWRVVVWNSSPDDAESVAVRLPVGMPVPDEVVHVDGGGRRLPVPYVDGRLELREPLRQWEFVVLRAG